MTPKNLGVSHPSVLLAAFEAILTLNPYVGQQLQA